MTRSPSPAPSAIGCIQPKASETPESRISGPRVCHFTTTARSGCKSWRIGPSACNPDGGEQSGPKKPSQTRTAPAKPSTSALQPCCFGGLSEDEIDTLSQLMVTFLEAEANLNAHESSITNWKK